MANRQKTRSGNHPQLEPRGPSFLMAEGVIMPIGLLTGIPKHTVEAAPGRFSPSALVHSSLYNELAFGRCVSTNVRRDGRSRVRLNDRALNLRQRAPVGTDILNDCGVPLLKGT
jgi:hypothetical protein